MREWDDKVELLERLAKAADDVEQTLPRSHYQRYVGPAKMIAMMNVLINQSREDEAKEEEVPEVEAEVLPAPVPQPPSRAAQERGDRLLPEVEYDS